MANMLKLLTDNICFIPFGFILIFWFLEERVRREELEVKVHKIVEKKINHKYVALNGDNSVCTPPLKVLIEEANSEKVLQLYFEHYPRIVKYLNILQRRRIALFIAAAFLLWIVMFILNLIPKTVLPSETFETIRTWLNVLGLMSLCAFAALMWYSRFKPIRSFCDELDKIGD